MFLSCTADSPWKISQSHCQPSSVLFKQKMIYTIYSALPGNPTLFSFNSVKYQENGPLNLQRQRKMEVEEHSKEEFIFSNFL